MEYIRFGSTGLKVSRICLGCMSYGGATECWQWALDEEQSRPFIKRAGVGHQLLRYCQCLLRWRERKGRYHLDDAVASLSVQLTPDEIRHLEEAYQPHPVLGYV